MLTEIQSKALLFLDRFSREYGFSPSYDQIAIGVGLKAKSGINRIVRDLESRGYIKRIPDRARAIEIIKMPPGLDDRHLQERLMAVVKAASAIFSHPDGHVVGNLDNLRDAVNKLHYGDIK